MNSASWFPVPYALIYDNRDWRALSTVAKVMMLCCISECNLREGSFYRSHADWAVRLRVCIRTVNRTKNELVALGWLDVTPGTRKGQRRLATTYSVKYPPFQPSEYPVGAFWVKMPRFMWDWVLYYLGTEAALAYFYLSAEYHRHQLLYQTVCEFSVSLGDMQRASGLSDFHDQLKRIKKNLHIDRDKHLFEFRGNRKMILHSWTIAIEDNNAGQIQRREADIAEKAKDLQAKARLRPQSTKRFYERRSPTVKSAN